MSLTATAENCIARFSSPKCKTELLVSRIVGEIPTATRATRGSPKNFASSEPAAAKPIVSNKAPPTAIQNRLLANR